MNKNILYGGVLIYDAEFDEQLGIFLKLAVAINNKVTDLKFYVHKDINDAINLKLIYRANSLIYHPDKLNKINKEISNEFFKYIKFDENDTTHNNQIYKNIKKSFIYLLYLKLYGYYDKQLMVDDKNKYLIFLKDLIHAINTYFYDKNKNKINFISLNNEETTMENKTPGIKKPNTQSKLLAIKHHNTVLS